MQVVGGIRMVDKSNSETTEIRFVVLRHTDRQGLHFDLMIDLGKLLATWKFPQPPESPAVHGLGCTRIGDHRRIYLDYEGPILGDRGSVSRHDYGECEILTRNDETWLVKFRGQMLMGRYKLERCDMENHGWLLRRVLD